ncbi:MAG: hypothetical protein SNJ54_14910 [Anaerolineae bacterium]
MIPQAVQERLYPYGVRSFWYKDSAIAALVSSDSLRPEAIREAEQVVADLIAQSPDPHNAYILFHLQKLNALSPKLRHSAQGIINSLPPGVTLYGALLVDNSLVANLLNVFSATLRRQSGGRYHNRLFKDEAEAFAWLQAQRTQTAST